MSTQPDLHDLIQADIDGTASPAERERLRDLLSQNSEAREEHRRLSALKGLLASIPPEAPPEPLRARVMRAIRVDRAQRSGSIVRRIFPSWASGRIALPYAYAAAAGVVIGILGFHVLSGQGSLGDAIERDAAATIGSAPFGTEAGRVVLTGGGIEGTATLRKVDGTLAVDVDFPSVSGFDAGIDFDPAAVKFIGLSNRTGGVERFQVTDGSVRWSSSRPQRVTVFLAARTPAPSEVTVTFSTEGGAAGSGALQLPGRD